MNIDSLERTVAECIHPKCAPSFDEVAATHLDEHAVRARWPRFEGECPDCGDLVICYASAMHYIMGDW